MWGDVSVKKKNTCTGVTAV